MKKLLTISLLVLSNLVLSSVLRADVRLPSVLGNGMVLQQGKTVSIWGWADAGEKVSVAFGNQTSESVADAKGKWIIKLGKMKANSEGSTLSVTGKNKVEVKDVLVGEIWLCSGQSNMKFGMKNSKYMDEEIPKAQYPNIRLFQVPANKSRSEFCEDVNGMWQKCTPETVATFSAVAYHFGKNLHENLNVPIALIQSAVGATPIGQWIALEGKKKVNSLKGNGSGPCYKGMIHPLINLSIRGVIWYQGETNVIYGDTDIYTDKMIALVEGWRETFMDKDMSFYFVQLPPYTYSTRKGTRNLTPESLAKVWDAQSLCLKKISNCGMVVISDMLESVGNIHPENKRDVGYRLSLWAMAKNYGKSEVVYSGPIYSSMKNDGNRIRLEFDYVGGGLRSLDGKALSQFQIAGSDKVFKDVIATISGDTVILEHQDIASPVAARFAWHEAKIGNLGNQAGLPASPFRTDKWSADKPPNIILIMADDFGWDISALGQTAYQTPEMDKLIKGGMQFSDFHSNGACCTPTRAAFLTGKYQQRTGMVRPMNAEFHGHAGMPSEEVTLAEILRRANYETALFGKWHLGEVGGMHPLGQGFDEFKGFLAGNIDHHSHVNRVPNRDWWDGRTLKDQKGYSTDLITDNTLAFIDEHHDKPFFIFVAHAATHAPFQDRTSPVQRPLGQGTRDKEDHSKKVQDDRIKRIYPNMVRAIDEGVGKVVETLKKHNISDNTIIFFMSDNGPVLKGRRGRNGKLVGNKGNIEEGGHRVPAFVYWPGHITAGSSSSATLMGMDLMPTFAKFAGVDISHLKNIDGVDASEVFLKNRPIADRDLFWSHHHMLAIRNQEWKLLRNTKRELKLHRLDEFGVGETKDLSKEYPEKMASMKQRLFAWDAKMQVIFKSRQVAAGMDQKIPVKSEWADSPAPKR